jgi:hypothetical protein
MSTDKTQPVTYALVLECPDLGKASELISEAVGELIADFLLNATNADERIDEEWYAAVLREKLFDETGEVVPWWYSEQEELSFTRDPIGHVKQYAWELEGYLESIARLNEDQINLMERVLTVSDIKVGHTLNNHITLLVRGHYHGNP